MIATEGRNISLGMTRFTTLPHLIVASRDSS